MNVVSVCCKLNFSFDSIIQIVHFISDFLLESFRSIIYDKKLFREQAHIIYEELCDSDCVFAVAYNCKAFAENTSFKQSISKSFYIIVEFCFFFGYYALRQVLVCAGKFRNSTQKLCRFSCTNRKHRILQKLNAEAALKIFCTFKASPRRNKNRVFSFRHFLKIVQSAAKAKNCVWFQSNCTQKIFNFAQIAKPVRILLWRSYKKIYKTFFFNRLAVSISPDFYNFFAFKILLKNRFQNPVVTDVVVSLKARSLCPNYRLLRISKIAGNFFNVITDNFACTARKHHKQIGVNNFKGIFYSRAQLIASAENYFLFTN